MQFLHKMAAGAISRIPILTNNISDEKYLKLMYYLIRGEKLNISNPKRFNEKLQWLKLHDRNPLYTSMVDKYEVRKYVADRIGEEYLVPLLGVWDKYEDINFNLLPNQFVLKCTHDSGSVIICTDKMKLDYRNANRKINKSLNKNYFWGGREWPYNDVKPRIIAEKFINGKDNEFNVQPPTDYKLMCFNGKVKCIFTCTNRISKTGLNVTFFDLNWVKLPFERHYPKDEDDIPKPKCLEKMICFAECLAKELCFSRIDFYETCGKIYFGEITLYPGSGFEEFAPDEWDYILGSWLKLDNGDD